MKLQCNPQLAFLAQSTRGLHIWNEKQLNETPRQADITYEQQMVTETRTWDTSSP